MIYKDVGFKAGWPTMEILYWKNTGDADTWVMTAQQSLDFGEDDIGLHEGGALASVPITSLNAAF